MTNMGETARQLRQLMEAFLLQIRHQVPRLQSRNSKQELMGAVANLVTIIQQHTGMLDTLVMAVLKAEAEGEFAPGTVPVAEPSAPLPPEPGEGGVVAGPDGKPDPEPVPAAAAPVVDEAYPELIAAEAIARVRVSALEKRLDDTRERIRLYEDCRDFLLMQIDELGSEVAQLTQELDATGREARRHLADVVRLERDLNETKGALEANSKAARRHLADVVRLEKALATARTEPKPFP